MNRYTITLDGLTYEVEILSDPTGDKVEVRVDGEHFQVHIRDAAPTAAATSSSEKPRASAAEAAVPAAPSSARGDQLVSPLPGTVISVSVRPGQRVQAGEELFVIEAMKMNNRIRSPRGGTVDRVLVEVGQPVSHGAPLLSWAE
jgi:biotin carboxyl carrier protein